MRIITPFYFATRENKWLEFLQPYLKPWLTPALTSDQTYNRVVVEGWYTGLRTGEPIPWGAWLVPLFVWGSFVLVSYIMLGCLSVMLRAQWAEREALAQRRREIFRCHHKMLRGHAWTRGRTEA